MPDGSSAAAKRQASAFGIGAIGINPHRCAAGDRTLDGLDAIGIGLRVLADLDFEGAKAVLKPPLDLLLDLLGAELLNGVRRGSFTSRSIRSSG